MPIRIFISYARKDLEHLETLETHLANLKRQGIIEVWTDQKLLASTEWSPALLAQLRSAQLVLVLISPDMMASDFIHDIELKETLQRHEKGKVRVVPILVRPTDLKGHALDRLQGLPRNFTPVTKWPNLDEAWLDVVTELRKLLDDISPCWEVWVKHTLERHRYLELAGIRRPSQGWQRTELEQVYVELQAEGEGGRDPLGLHEVLKRSRRLLILGDPGCGKTTLLRYVARKLALGWLAEHESASAKQDAQEARTLLRLPADKPLPVPVLLTLASLSNFLDERKLATRNVHEQVVRDFLLQQLQRVACELTEESLKRALEKDEILLLLDGLDEVPEQGDRIRVCTAVRVLLERFREAPLILTSRTRAFQGGVSDALSLLPRYVVQPMSPKEVARFLTLWFKADSPGDPEKAILQAEKLHQEIKAHRELSQMALNPNILTLVALLRRRSPNAKLPERRVDLYREVIPLFLDRRDVDRGADDAWNALALKLDEYEKVSLVARLALELHEHGAKREGEKKASGARTVPEDRVVRNLADQLLLNGKVPALQAQFKAKRLLHWLEERPGLLRLTDEGVEFTHLGYQEYLAAVALSERHLTDEGLLAEVLPRLMDDWWNEPIRLLLTLLEGRAEVLLTALSNAGMAADGTMNWQRQGRGLALAMGAVQDIPADRIPHARALVLKRMDGLLGRESTANVGDRLEALLSLGRVGDPRLGLEKPENWIYLPPGELRMGSDEGRDNEKPIHQVKLTQGFYLSRFPVTNHDFRPFVEGDGYRNRQWWSSEGWAFKEQKKLTKPRFWEEAQFNAPNQPVVGISWFEAQAFCMWLSRQRFSSEVRGPFCLPTEAEWEYAARGQEGRKYPWGHEEPTPERANYNQTGVGTISPVGAFPQGATPEGLLDLAGNVWEWCEDGWANNYETTPRDGTAQPEGAVALRVVRGGALLTVPVGLRSSARDGDGAGGRYDYQGFRLVAVSSRPWHGLQGP